MNRETWLNEMAQRMAPKFEELGYPLPKFRVSIGFPSRGANSGANGECWNKSCTADESFSIFISPGEATSMAISAILCHELIHAAVGLSEGHKGKFALVMKAMGMERPYTSSVPGPEFISWVRPMVDDLGEIPHAQLRTRQKTAAGELLKLFKKSPGGIDADGEGEDDGEPDSNRPKKQTTRMVKCECGECGYIARTSQKWLDEVGPPHCPSHGAMRVEA